LNGSGKFALGNEDCIWIIQTTQLQKLSRLLFQYWIATALDHKEKFCSKSCFHSDQRALIRCQLAHRPQYWQRILSTVFWDPHQQFHHNVYCIRTILQSYSAFRNRSQCIQDRKTQFQTFGLQTRQQLNQLRNSPNAYQQNLNFWMQAHCSQEPQSRADSIWMPLVFNQPHQPNQKTMAPENLQLEILPFNQCLNQPRAIDLRLNWTLIQNVHHQGNPCRLQ